MAILDGFEVRIKNSRRRTAYREYEPPEDAKATGKHQAVQYIEAEDYEEYYVSVKSRSGVELHGATDIGMVLNIDGGIFNGNRRGEDLLRNGRERFESIVRYIDGRLNDINLKFGPLGIDEELELEDDLEKEQVQHLGTIVVTLQRGFFTGEGECETFLEDKQHIEKSTKDVVKKMGISHTTVPISFGSISPPMYGASWEPLSGDYGQPICFTFRYRSHLSLQRLGLISVTPDPDPVDEARYSQFVRSWRSSEREKDKRSASNETDKNKAESSESVQFPNTGQPRSLGARKSHQKDVRLSSGQTTPMCSIKEEDKESSGDLGVVPAREPVSPRALHGPEAYAQDRTTSRRTSQRGISAPSGSSDPKPRKMDVDFRRRTGAPVREPRQQTLASPPSERTRKRRDPPFDAEGQVRPTSNDPKRVKKAPSSSSNVDMSSIRAGRPNMETSWSDHMAVDQAEADSEQTSEQSGARNRERWSFVAMSPKQQNSDRNS
ncbi:MAG: hypothetical protein M1812_007068 [Candelaria pacifica]|nr:MAG: hypothetical protein M1812_007068 [Candelaria pacifica]